MLPLSADEEIMLTPAGRRSHSSTATGQGQSSTHGPSSQPVGMKTERTKSRKAMSCENGDKTPSRSLQDRRAMPPTSGAPTAETPTSSVDGKVAQELGKGREAIAGKDKSPSRKATIPRFLNGDMKKSLPDGRGVYRHAGSQITRATYPDGLEVVQFPSKQTEKYHRDGSKEVVFPDGTVKHLRDGREETVFPDGTAISVERNGDRTIVLSNGQREIQTSCFKRREYPDGTAKTVYCTGYRETQYASGKAALKTSKILSVSWFLY
ncbi:centromere protein J-like isoform X2 [Hyaena hyaena]|uniref:centromere protein J-like isoform X2 n=1 Tax=Hyaena hyaena TaxID=95912 RepID=UPI001923CEC6|nr:centromere protein J-like isoform X2 [Hyaena hyaena]